MCIASLCVQFESHTDEWSLIQELHKFKLGHNTVEATKNVCCAKGECAVVTVQ